MGLLCASFVGVVVCCDLYLCHLERLIIMFKTHFFPFRLQLSLFIQSCGVNNFLADYNTHNIMLCLDYYRLMPGGFRTKGAFSVVGKRSNGYNFSTRDVQYD